jgi:hypothetical protein
VSLPYFLHSTCPLQEANVVKSHLDIVPSSLSSLAILAFRALNLSAKPEMDFQVGVLPDVEHLEFEASHPVSDKLVSLLLRASVLLGR